MSSDFETNITQQVAQGKAKSVKKKPKSIAVVATDSDHGKNEGDDPHWAYEPPEGAMLLDHTVDVGEFEWEAIKDDENVELWLIRVPDGLKPKHLQRLEIDIPSSSRTAHIGSLTRRTTSYDVWSLGDDDADIAGGEELRGLTCLLPRKRKKGKLYVAPKRISQHIVVSARPSIATAPEHQPVVYQNPPRRSYPKDMLKHTFVPYGARSEQIRSEGVSMDAGDIETTQERLVSDTAPPSEDKPEEKKESKGKKRKAGEDSPKKSKRHKTGA